MTRRLLATYADAGAATEAIRAARAGSFSLEDAFSPFPLDGASAPAAGERTIGWAAFAGALFGGGGVFALESFSAIIAYPFNSGGRPTFSWPVFFLAPFEIGVLFAAAFAFVAFLRRTGLPRLNHPAFEIDGIERASQDQILLLFAEPDEDASRAALHRLLGEAVALREIVE